MFSHLAQKICSGFPRTVKEGRKEQVHISLLCAHYKEDVGVKGRRAKEQLAYACLFSTS